MSKIARAPGLNPSGVNSLDESAHVFGPEVTTDTIIHFDGYEAGRIYYGSNRHVEYICGSLPIIITVPHGGYAAPAEIPNRIGGVHEPDILTQELARLLQQSFASQLGIPNAYPHMIINRLQRGRLDMNRNEQDATGGNPITKKAWRQFHAFVRRAKREIVRGRSITHADAAVIPSSAATPAAFCRGLCIDLHGQSHDARHQLGYVLTESELASHTDQQLNEVTNPSIRAMVEKCSMRIAIDQPLKPHDSVSSSSIAHIGNSALGLPRSQSPPTFFSEILRGTKSLGCFLEELGHPCIPSPTSPCARGHYFNGGYNSHVNGSGHVGMQQRRKERAADLEAAAAGGAVASKTPAIDPDVTFTNLFDSILEFECFIAIQMETAYEGHRDSEANMQRFANSMAKALSRFVDTHVLKEGERFPTPQLVAIASATTAAAEQ